MPESRLVIVWRATERCDTACAFCAYDVRVRRPRRELEAGEALRFGTLVAGLGRDVLLSWLGGEPLLWPPLREVCSVLRGRGLRLGVTTNGRALADPAWRAWAADTLDELTLSIDGPPAVHDALRGRAGLGDSLLATLADLRARARRPLLRVNTVLMHDNVARFEELCELVARAGADELTFNALGGNDRPEFFPAHRLRPGDVERLAAALPAARAHGLVVRGGDGYLARLRASAHDRPLAVDDCAPGRQFWFIEIDGRLSPCSFTVAEHGIPIESLRTHADLDAIPARLQAARARTAAAACADCPSTQVHAKFGEAAPP